MKPTTLYLLRHGSTIFNEDSDRFCGRTDPSLSSIGIKQINKIALELKNILSVSHIVTSPLKRAVESAEIINRELASPYIVNNDIREIDFGEWEGLTKAEINVKYPDVMQKWFLRPDLTIPPGGETPQDVVKRAISFRKQVIEKEGAILIVSHKTFLRIAMCTWLSIPLENYRHIFNIHSGSLSCIRLDSIGSKLVLLNWVPGQDIPRLMEND